MPVFTTDLTRHQKSALSALASRPIVRHGSFWRIKGAPAPIVSAFALATLEGLGLIIESRPDTLALTPEGRAMVRRLEARAA